MHIVDVISAMHDQTEHVIVVLLSNGRLLVPMR